MTPAPNGSPPRRLPRQARRDQLIAAAIPLLARQGPLGLSLDEVAARAGVTRNLLYHYFPGGRADLVTGVVREAERQLLGNSARAGTSAEEHEPALSRIFDHALAPTHAWRIHRMARAGGVPGATEAVERSTQEVVSRLAGRQRAPDGLASPIEVALHGYVAFAEAVLDSARSAQLSRIQIRHLLGQTLQAILSAE